MQPDQLAAELYAAAQRLLRALRTKHKTADLSGERLSTLLTLGSSGHASIKQLAESEHVAHSTMSRMVSSLTMAGLAEAHGHGVDRRTSSIKLTKKGKRTAKRALDRMSGPLATAIDSLPAEEQAELARSIDVLKAVLQRVEKE